MYKRQVRNRTCSSRLVELNNNFNFDLKNLKEADEYKIARIENDEKRHNDDQNTFSTNNC